MWRFGFFLVLYIFYNSSIIAQNRINHWESIVISENSWKYFPGTSQPENNWINLDYDDSSWAEGPGGFGYGDNDDGTIIDPAISVYLRIKFTIFDLAQMEKVVLLADYDDAFVAYLNGQEIARSGIAGTRPTYTQYASTDHEAGLYRGIYPEAFTIAKTQLTALLTTGENILAIQVHNVNAISSDLSSNFYLNVGLSSSSTVYQQTPSWFRPPLDFKSSNLPIVKIDTKSRSIPDEPKISASMSIIDNGPENLNFTADSATGYNGSIGIEIRGSSSQMFPKKQYAVELWTENGEDTSASVLGLPPEEDWVLSAPYTDKSLIRNVLSYKLGTDLGRYAPRTKLVELYINEDYRGVYVFTEKIKRDKNRVDISTLNPDENSGDDLTGGYIVKLDKYDGATEGLGWDSPYREANSNGDPVHFQYHYPREDEITAEQGNYIENYVTEFERTLNGPNFRESREGYRKYINVESFIDFAIINEVTRNVDGYRLSTFLYKDKDSKDEKLYLGPIWDFNLAFGNADYCEGGNTSGWAWDFNTICNGGTWMVPFWWKRLLRDPEYVIQFQARWSYLRENQYSNETIMNYIDSLETVLDQPQQRNFTRWPILNQYIWPNNYVGNTYSNELNYLKNWIVNRLSWLDANIARLEVITDLPEKPNAQGNISIYPNPNQGNFHIRFDKMPKSDFKIEIFNHLGKSIFFKLNNMSNIEGHSLPIESLSTNLPSGLYLVNISDDKKLNRTEKFVVN